MTDADLIAGWVAPGARVLDLGCGDGVLLRRLWQTRQAPGYGVEIDDAKVLQCLKNDVNVLQMDLEDGLAAFADRSFDYVILSETLQAIHKQEPLLKEMLRVGREAIVSFPNFGYWRVRAQLLLLGRMPRATNLQYSWHETPNIHLCTIKDFVELAEEVGAVIERGMALDRAGWPFRTAAPLPVMNLFGAQAIFLLKRGRDANG